MGEERDRGPTVTLIRLHVVAEGQTEENFIKAVLAPELWTYQVLTDVHRVTTGRRRSRVFRGGLTTYQQLRNDLHRWMTEDQNLDAHFTTMVDLYRLPADFPGHQDCLGHADPLARAECLEQKLWREINHPRFVPYLQIHEFESLLFSDPSKFLIAFPARSDAIQRLQEIRGQFPSPEHIDDGAKTAPSKRIASLLPEYVKPVAGPLIIRHIGLHNLRRECAHFDAWIQRLQALAAGLS